MNTETGEGYIVGSPSGISTGARHEDPQMNPSAQPDYRVGRGGYEATVTDGGISVTGGGSASLTSADFVQEGDIVSTALNSYGAPIIDRPLQEGDTIEYMGMRLEVSQAARSGLLSKNLVGEFVSTDVGNAGAGDGGEAEAKEAPATDVLRMDDASEAAMDTLVLETTPTTQAAAIEEIAANGDISPNTINRLASEAGVTPEEMADKIETVHAGFYTEIAARMEGLGVHDMEGFGEWIASDGRLSAESQEATRALLRDNATEGFEALASKYVSALDTIDPEAVLGACEEAGIETFRGVNGSLVLTIPGHGQASWREAVQLGVIKVSKAG